METRNSTTEREPNGQACRVVHGARRKCRLLCDRVLCFPTARYPNRTRFGTVGVGAVCVFVPRASEVQVFADWWRHQPAPSFIVNLCARALNMRAVFSLGFAQVYPRSSNCE